MKENANSAVVDDSGLAEVSGGITAGGPTPHASEFSLDRVGGSIMKGHASDDQQTADAILSEVK